MVDASRSLVLGETGFFARRHPRELTILPCQVHLRLLRVRDHPLTRGVLCSWLTTICSQHPLHHRLNAHFRLSTASDSTSSTRQTLPHDDSTFTTLLRCTLYSTSDQQRSSTLSTKRSRPRPGHLSVCAGTPMSFGSEADALARAAAVMGMSTVQLGASRMSAGVQEDQVISFV